MVLGIMLTGLTASAQLDKTTVYKAKVAAVMAERAALIATLPPNGQEELKAYELRLAAMTDTERLDVMLNHQLTCAKLSRCFYQLCLLGAEYHGKTDDVASHTAALDRLEKSISRLQKRIATGRWEPIRPPSPVNK